jgi:hypothetical protein
MSVVDPIFSSLWDATLSELQSDTALWEVYLDTPNFFSGDPPDARAAAAEAVIRRLRREGWATIVRRPARASGRSPGTLLSDDEIDAVLATARTWYSASPELPPPDSLNVWLAPLPRWREWAKTAYG